MGAVAGGRQGLVRASDVDRARTVEQLSEAHSAGRLTLEEFDERMAKALIARTIAELAELVTDLPAPTDLVRLHDLADALLTTAAKLGISRAELVALLAREAPAPPETSRGVR